MVLLQPEEKKTVPGVITFTPWDWSHRLHSFLHSGAGSPCLGKFLAGSPQVWMPSLEEIDTCKEARPCAD
ncbi:hypothetical protein Y1Q_0024635 [Alligator mississippiensis]|uniref:Uncharacterized protein n=1 Tax=Alligator mississippiensis TaxID=8496 RepID=A0A151NBQ0_ALLMI|nr:hypothetical protein Y1Q_0024635 [Alligator mississippiensis]